MDVHSDPPSGPGVSLSDDDLAKLLEVGRTLVAELDVEAVLRRVLDTARELTGARYAALGILDERKEELERFLFVRHRRGDAARDRHASARAAACSAS